MKFATDHQDTTDHNQQIAFYARLTGVQPVRLARTFAEVRLPGGAVLALSSEDMIKQFNAGAAVAASNRSAIIEFEVDDVDAEHQRLGDSVDHAMPPTTMPWGNRSMLLRDPDGNVVNLFARPAAA